LKGLEQRIKQPICKSINLDFKVDGSGFFTHLESQHFVASEILRKQNQTIAIKIMAYEMGGTIVRQKERFCGLQQGPERSENVLHIVDLRYISPLEKKDIVKEYYLKGAEDVVSSKEFLNELKKYLLAYF